MSSKRAAWYLHSIGGLLLTGAGLSIIGEAILRKGLGGDWVIWFVLGTLGLIVFNSGLALVAKAAVLLVELRQKKRHELRRLRRQRQTARESRQEQGNLKRF